MEKKKDPPPENDSGKSSEGEKDVVLEGEDPKSSEPEKAVSPKDDTEVTLKNKEEDRIKRYERVREVGRELTGKIMKHLPRFVLENTAYDLSMKRGKYLVVDTEDESAFLMDRCFHDVYWGEQNKNLIGHFMDSEDYRQLSEEERAIVQGMSDAYYSLFEIVDVNPLECTLELDDLLGDKTYTITDINLSLTAREGNLLAARIKCVDGIPMTSGAVCPFEPHQTGLLLNGLKPKETPAGGKGKKKKKFRGVQRSDYSVYFYRQYKRISRIPFRISESSG